MTRPDLFGRAGKRALLLYFAVWGAAAAYLAVGGGWSTDPV